MGVPVYRTGRAHRCPLPPVRVHDAYVAGAGTLHASMLGLFSLALEIPPQCARTHRQDHVVQRYIRRLRNCLDAIDAPRLGDESSRTRDVRVDACVRYVTPGHGQAIAHAQPRFSIVSDYAKEMR